MRRTVLLMLGLIVLLTLGAYAAAAQSVYIVQPGDTLFRVALKLGKTVAEIKQVNNLTSNIIHVGNQLIVPGSAPAPATQGSQQPAATTSTVYAAYSVQPGDSLAGIAAKFGMTFQQLAQLNAISNPDVLFVGQVLRVIAPASAPATAPSGSQPAATTGAYTVQPGDSLSRIAAKFNISYLELARLNGISNPDVLSVGMVLQVPGAPPPAAQPQPSEGQPAQTGPAPASTANVSGFELGGQSLRFAHIDKMHESRMTWVKRQVKWHGEPASHFQHLIDSAKGNGLKVLLSVIGDPNSIRANPGGYYQSFANFLAGLARGGADAIEVWNEMNIDREWPRGMISAANYTQMLSAAYHAIKGANPNTMVISGAPAPTGWFQGCTANGGDDDCYMRNMAAAGAANVMDCVGVHYNAGIVHPDATSGAPVGSSGHYSWYLPRMMSLYRSAFPTKPQCFTELGYLTGEGIGQLPSGFSWASGNTLAEQAAWLAGAVHRLRGSGYVRLFIVWNVDSDHWTEDPQMGYAIVRPGGGCPACQSLRAAMGG